MLSCEQTNIYKNIYNKRMSTNALVPFTFNYTKLFTVTIDGKSWTRAKEICESLEYNKETSKTANIIRAHCSIENITQKCHLIGVHESCTPVLWPADSQKYDLYINEQGMYELVFKSEQKSSKRLPRLLFQCNVSTNTRSLSTIGY